MRVRLSNGQSFELNPQTPFPSHQPDPNKVTEQQVRRGSTEFAPAKRRTKQPLHWNNSRGQRTSAGYLSGTGYRGARNINGMIYAAPDKTGTITQEEYYK